MDKHERVLVVQLADHPCVRMRKVIRSFIGREVKVGYVGCRRGRPRGDSLDCERINVRPAIPSASLAKIFLAPVWAVAAALHIRSRRSKVVCYAADFEAGVAALLSGRPYVYDVLDTYADRYDAPRVLKSLLRWMEGVVARRAEALVHVDKIRLQTLALSPRTFVVRNVPIQSDVPSAHEADTFDVIASGNLDENRGVDQLLDAAREVGARVALIGRMSGSVSRKASSIPSVTYLGYVDSAMALSLTRRSRAVFAAYDPARSINVLACPNKFYDAIACGLPIILNKEITLAGTVQKDGLGWTFAFGHVSELIVILRAIQRSDEHYIRARDVSRQASEHFCYWDQEFSPVLDVVLRLLK